MIDLAEFLIEKSPALAGEKFEFGGESVAVSEAVRTAKEIRAAILDHDRYYDKDLDGDLVSYSVNAMRKVLKEGGLHSSADHPDVMKFRAMLRKAEPTDDELVVKQMFEQEIERYFVACNRLAMVIREKSAEGTSGELALLFVRSLGK